MSEPQTLERASDEALNSHRPKQKRLTATDRAFALRYAKDGLTQTEIAKRLGVTQSAISLWLKECRDTRAEAGQYLDGQALPMSMRAVKHASPTDLIKLLTGRGVLKSDENRGITQLVVGVSLPGLPCQSAGSATTVPALSPECQVIDSETVGNL